ncbi:MAG: DNA adenine methylase [Chloroflexi bacterium]|nr:MAG: DNA adenine methylase [Chloroflexota bacterium]
MIEYDQTTLWPKVAADESVLRAERLTSLLKWAGGKEQELKYILPLIPSFDTYYEPFVGGGAVFFSIQSRKKFINDKSPDLFNLYTMIAKQNLDFFQALNTLLLGWQRVSEIVDGCATHLLNIYKAYSIDKNSLEEMRSSLLEFVRQYAVEFNTMFEAFFDKDTGNFIRELQRNLLNKTRRMKEIENRKWKLSEQDVIANIECALKSAFYMHLRHLYNKIGEYGIPASQAAAIFFFVRENAYASMFRYNSKGEFNVPYGGLSYNRKDLARKVAYLQSSEVELHLRNTVIENMDFEAFLQKYPPRAEDFVFLDPPYDSEFSTYSQNEFGREDQERLANYLLKQCKAKFMLVIKNTPTILHLYGNAGLNIRKTFDKKYLVSFQDRNNRDAEHLIITNF